MKPHSSLFVLTTTLYKITEKNAYFLGLIRFSSFKSLLQSIKGKVDLPFVVYPECGGEWKDGE